MVGGQAVQRAADNALLTVVARAAMALSLPVLSAVAWFIWNDHDAIGQQGAQLASANYAIASAQSDIKDIKGWEVDTNNTVGSVENRLTTVEVNQKNGQDRSVQTQATLKDMQSQISLILQQTAAINATLKNRLPLDPP